MKDFKDNEMAMLEEKFNKKNEVPDPKEEQYRK